MARENYVLAALALTLPLAVTSIAGCPTNTDLGGCEFPDLSYNAPDGTRDWCHCTDVDGGYDAGKFDPPTYCDMYRTNSREAGADAEGP